VSDVLTSLRVVAEALPSGTAIPVPRDVLLKLLDRTPTAAGPHMPEVPNAEGQPSQDRLLTVDQAASRLAVTSDWLYRHWHKVPGAVKLGRRQLRFSAARLDRFVEARRRDGLR
jgi:excisionase family DNA binding protein